MPGLGPVEMPETSGHLKEGTKVKTRVDILSLSLSLSLRHIESVRADLTGQRVRRVEWKDGGLISRRQRKTEVSRSVTLPVSTST